MLVIGLYIEGTQNTYTFYDTNLFVTFRFVASSIFFDNLCIKGSSISNVYGSASGCSWNFKGSPIFWVCSYHASSAYFISLSHVCTVFATVLRALASCRVKLILSLSHTKVNTAIKNISHNFNRIKTVGFNYPNFVVQKLLARLWHFPCLWQLGPWILNNPWQFSLGQEVMKYRTKRR